MEGPPLQLLETAAERICKQVGAWGGGGPVEGGGGGGRGRAGR